jgi:hypothetical protein
MGNPSFRSRLRVGAGRLRARLSRSPDIWDERADQMDDVSAWLELPQGFRAPDADDSAYRSSSRFELSRTGDERDEW